MHPFVHAFPRRSTRRGRPERLRDLPRGGPQLSELATHLGVRQRPRGVPLQHDTPGETAQPGGVVRDWARGCRPVPGRTMPGLPWSSGTTAPIADKLGRLGPLADRLGLTAKDVTSAGAGGRPPARGNGVMLGGVADGRPGAGHRRQDGRDDPGALRHDQRRARDKVPAAGAATGSSWPTWPRARRRSGSPSPTPRPAGPVITSPEWSGARPAAPLRAVHDERRAAQALAHPDRSACTSSWTTTGCPTSARGCRSTGPHWTCTGSSASPQLGPDGACR